MSEDKDLKLHIIFSFLVKIDIPNITETLNTENTNSKSNQKGKEMAKCRMYSGNYVCLGWLRHWAYTGGRQWNVWKLVWAHCKEASLPGYAVCS